MKKLIQKLLGTGMLGALLLVGNMEAAWTLPAIKRILHWGTRIANPPIAEAPAPQEQNQPENAPRPRANNSSILAGATSLSGLGSCIKKIYSEKTEVITKTVTEGIDSIIKPVAKSICEGTKLIGDTLYAGLSNPQVQMPLLITAGACTFYLAHKYLVPKAICALETWKTKSLTKEIEQVTTDINNVKFSFSVKRSAADEILSEMPPVEPQSFSEIQCKLDAIKKVLGQIPATEKVVQAKPSFIGRWMASAKMAGSSIQTAFRKDTTGARSSKDRVTWTQAHCGTKAISLAMAALAVKTVAYLLPVATR